eukprot:125660-Rhodomonas_salina.4
MVVSNSSTELGYGATRGERIGCGGSGHVHITCRLYPSRVLLPAYAPATRCSVLTLRGMCYGRAGRRVAAYTSSVPDIV